MPNAAKGFFDSAILTDDDGIPVRSRKSLILIGLQDYIKKNITGKPWK
jgi:hypothetical protein